MNDLGHAVILEMTNYFVFKYSFEMEWVHFHIKKSKMDITLCLN